MGAARAYARQEERQARISRKRPAKHSQRAWPDGAGIAGECHGGEGSRARPHTAPWAWQPLALDLERLRPPRLRW